MRTLQEAVSYQNDEVVAKFKRKFALSNAQAEDIFTETTRWLWFAANTKSGSVAIDQSTLIIDEMWHIFIAFTEDYFEFCRRNFGHYLHHRPTSHEEQRDAYNAQGDDPAAFLAKRRDRINRQYSSVREMLGEPTLKKWHLDYRFEYPPERCRELALRALEQELGHRSDVLQISAGHADPARFANLTGSALTSALVELELVAPTANGPCVDGSRHCSGFACVCNKPHG
jgi:hypothetical protein